MWPCGSQLFCSHGVLSSNASELQNEVDALKKGGATSGQTQLDDNESYGSDTDQDDQEELPRKRLRSDNEGDKASQDLDDSQNILNI